MSSVSSPTSKSIYRSYQLLCEFAETSAYEVGIRERVQVIFSDQVKTTSYDLSSKTIFVNFLIAANYGKMENPLYMFFDFLPHKKESIRQHLEGVDLVQRNNLQTTLESGFTDREMEAMLLHEIGHLFCRHVNGVRKTIDGKYKEIFDADLFAHRSYRGRTGFFRLMKRQIVLDLLIPASKPIQMSTEPSCETRLERALSCPYHAPNVLRIKSLAQQKLERFIQQKAKQIGISKNVTLEVTSEFNVKCSQPALHIIEFSRDIVENYGREDTIQDRIIDMLPRRYLELATFVDELTPFGFENFKKVFSTQLSTSEIEAVVLHELGHIKCAHKPVYSITFDQCRKEELEADSFAYKDPAVKDAFIRKCKREIIDAIIKRKKVIGDKLKTVGMRFYSNTHPSFETRLKRALSYEAKHYC